MAKINRQEDPMEKARKRAEEARARAASEAAAKVRESAAAESGAPMSGVKKAAVALAVVTAVGGAGWAAKKYAETGDAASPTGTVPAAPTRPDTTVAPQTRPAQAAHITTAAPSAGDAVFDQDHPERMPGMRGESWVALGKRTLAAGKTPFWSKETVNTSSPAGWTPPRGITAKEAFETFPFDEVPEVGGYRTLEAPEPKLTLLILRQVHRNCTDPIPNRYAGAERARYVQEKMLTIISWLAEHKIATACQNEGDGQTAMRFYQMGESEAYAEFHLNYFKRPAPGGLDAFRKDFLAHAGELSGAIGMSGPAMPTVPDPFGPPDVHEVERELLSFSYGTDASKFPASALRLCRTIREHRAGRENERAYPGVGNGFGHAPRATTRLSEEFMDRLSAFAEALEGFVAWELELQTGPRTGDLLFGAGFAAFFKEKVAVLQATTDQFDLAHIDRGDYDVLESREAEMLRFAAHPGYQMYGTCRMLTMGYAHDFLDQLKTHNQEHSEFQISAIEISPITVWGKEPWENIEILPDGHQRSTRTFLPPPTGRVVLPKRKPPAGSAPATAQKK